jgi:hypothetical protein
MEHVFLIGDQETSTDQLLTEIDVEHHRHARREAQRERRVNQDTNERDLTRKNNTDARRKAKVSLAIVDRARIRSADAAAHGASRTATQQAPETEHWWTRIHQLNSSQIPTNLGLHWNRTSKYCVWYQGMQLSFFNVVKV